MCEDAMMVGKVAVELMSCRTALRSDSSAALWQHTCTQMTADVMTFRHCVDAGNIMAYPSEPTTRNCPAVICSSSTADTKSSTALHSQQR
jgi:hypothetical protein